MAKAFLNGSSELKKAISKSGLAMINMSNDGEVSDEFWRVLGQINDAFLSGVVLAGLGTEQSTRNGKALMGYSGG